jgi:hypothetical protein
MSETLQGFLACVGAALFFATMLAAVKSIIWRSASPGAEEEFGAPEGDQVHFRAAEDDAIQAETPMRAGNSR